MTERNRHKVLVTAAIPPDLHAALARDYDVVDCKTLRQWLHEPAFGFSMAVTTSISGMDIPTMNALPDLKLIACHGVGLELLDLAEASRRGIAVSHTPDEAAHDVAECTIALTYAIMRRVAEADRFVRAGRWPKERILPSTRLAGKTMGIVGLGRIGGRIASLAAAVGMHVAYYSRRRRHGACYTFVPNLLDLAEQADVLALACPGGEATRHLINCAAPEKLGPRGYLINISRGTVVDEAALIAALTNGTIAGAALDVFASEPIINPRFAALENVVLQPHSSSITYEARSAIIDRFLRDLDAFLHGRPFFDAAALHAGGARKAI